MGHKNPLEWVTDIIQDVTSTTAGSANNGRIQLLLDRDEVADIYKVLVVLYPDILMVVDFAEDGQIVYGFYVSTDPRADTLFLAEADMINLEDRNVFYHNRIQWDQEIIVPAAPLANIVKASEHWEIDFGDNPLTVGGDLSWVAGALHAGLTTAQNGDMAITVYFRRRKSRNEKANLIMLRR